MSAANARVLVVDDDASLRQTIAMVLERAGYTVVQAASGEQALLLLAQSVQHNAPVEVVLSDIVMQAVDGVAVTRAARALPDPPEVILLTRHGKLETAMGAIDAGAFGYLLKPLKWHALLEKVAEAVHICRIKRDQREQAAAWQRIVGMLGDVEASPSAVAAPTAGAADAPPLPADVAEAATVARFLECGQLQIDTFRHKVTDAGVPLDLTPLEYTLLATLAESPGLIMPYTTLVAQTHQLQIESREAYQLLRTHVSNLRRKLQSCTIISVRGVGFILDMRDEKVR